MKKDRRGQERNLLVQIATSTFYLLQQQQQESGPNLDETSTQYHYDYYPMQDLIAVLLLHLESPSLTSLLLKQIIESHLWMFCSKPVDNDNVNDDSFESCLDIIDEAPDSSPSKEDHQDCNTTNSEQQLDVLSLSFFPLLQVLDKELHDSLLQEVDDSTSELIISQVLAMGNVLRVWISSWFCCHDTLPLEVVSRLIDLFLASHWSMPLYLSMAIVCHHRNKFIQLSPHQPLDEQQSTPQDTAAPDAPHQIHLAAVMDSLFLQESSDAAGRDDEIIINFMEEAISTAISFM